MMPTAEGATLCAAFLLYFAMAFIWPSWRVWRTTGLNPYVLPSTDDAHGFVTVGMRTIIVGLFAYVIFQMGWPHLERALGVLPWLVHPAVAAVGWAGLGVAVIWTIAAQYQMGKSWRIGIDTKHRTGLLRPAFFPYRETRFFLRCDSACSAWC